SRHGLEGLAGLSGDAGSDLLLRPSAGNELLDDQLRLGGVDLGAAGYGRLLPQDGLQGLLELLDGLLPASLRGAAVLAVDELPEGPVGDARHRGDPLEAQALLLKLLDELPGLVGVDVRLLHDTRQPLEIGRASCRERAWSWVGAVSVSAT